MTTKSNKTLTRAFVLTGTAVAVAASAFAGVALAQGKGPGPKGASGPRAGMFQMMDTNKDGKVTKDEFLGRASPFFERFDANGDGSVTKDEVTAVFMKRMQARAVNRTARFDANGDGTVTKDEFDTYRGKRFALMDRNNDGEIDVEEMRVMMPMMANGRGGGWRGHRGRGWGRGWHHNRPCGGWMRSGMGPGMRGGMGGGWMMQGGNMPGAPLDNGRGDQDADQ